MVSNRKEDLLKYEHERFKMIFEYSPIAIWEEDFSALAKLKKSLDNMGIDNYHKYLLENKDIVKATFREFKILDVNQAALNLYGAKTKDELIKNVGQRFQGSLMPILIEEFACLLKGNSTYTSDFKSKTLKGKLLDQHMKVSVPEVYMDTFERVIVTIQDISIQKKLERYLRKLSFTDGLTRLLNQRAILKQFDSEFIRAKRYSLDLSCLMIDIDNFKQINDRLGHQKGDYVLKKAAGLIRDHVREVDIVGRYGGDEFIVILPETPPECAEIVAIRLGNLFKDTFTQKKSLPLPVTLSIGVGYWPREDVKNPKHILANADAALYMSKRQGRDRITVA